MRQIPVHLQMDTDPKVPVGPVNLTMRACILLGIALPLSWLALQLHIDWTYKFSLAGAFAALAVGLAVPSIEGIWMGTHLFYGLLQRLMPSVIDRGAPKRARLSREDDLIVVPGHAAPQPYIRPEIDKYVNLPRVTSVLDGLFERQPGGWAAVLRLAGPEAPPGTDGYDLWCDSVLDWLRAVGVPAQMLVAAAHFDPAEAEIAYESRLSGRRLRLHDAEESYAVAVAKDTMVLTHHVVFAPGSADDEGMPIGQTLGTIAHMPFATEAEAGKVLASAINHAKAQRMEVWKPTAEEVRDLLATSVLGTREAKTCDGIVELGNYYHRYVVARKLPSMLHSGAIVDVLQRSRLRGGVSMHYYPISDIAARKVLKNRAQSFGYAASKGADDEADQAKLDTDVVRTRLAAREISMVRLAITFDVVGHTIQETEAKAEALLGILDAADLSPVTVSRPGFLPALAMAPGGAPMRRSLIMVADEAAGCLLPAMGTPLADPRNPLLGISPDTDSPVYLDTFGFQNFNSVIVGSSGSGKSVTCKTMLIRAFAFGARVVVIDPDSEYEPVMDILGGTFIELGRDALNPLAVNGAESPSQAAAMVLPVLSVMAGDIVGNADGRPIRRLDDAEKGLLGEELANFYDIWFDRHEAGVEPVLTNLVGYLRSVTLKRSDLTGTMLERVEQIALRLTQYTQQPKADMFNQQTSIDMRGRAVAIGLKHMGNRYAADLTPALVIILNHVLGEMAKKEGKLLLLVDEAHRVTCDPDAGEALAQMVRQARKYGAGVWLASQQVADFVDTDLGQVLVSNSATNILLGVKKVSGQRLQEVFELTDRETAILTGKCPRGRAVVLAEHDRAVVDVMPTPDFGPWLFTNAVQTEEAAEPISARR